MRITTPSILSINSNPTNKIRNLTVAQTENPGRTEYTHSLNSEIPFGAIHNIKPKKIDLNLEKNKLIKQISEILQMDLPDIDLSEMVMTAVRCATSFFLRKTERKAEILVLMDELTNNKMLNPQQKMNQFRQLEKEYKLLEKQKPKYIEPNIDEKLVAQMDFPLLNKFKTAISEDEFDLEKIFKNHYSKLKNIKTIEELNEIYPKIQTPTRPENVIANKITATLTRDFFEALDEIMTAGNAPEAFKFADKKVHAILTEAAKTYDIEEAALYARVAKPVYKSILDKYKNVVLNNSFSSLPQKRKVKQPPISKTDIKLLSVDFDDFVLSTLKHQYLDSKKLNEIIYTNDKVSIPISTLKEPEYKFEKIPEKIKKFITAADALKFAQRDYEHFNVEQLRSRLGFFANSELGNNEELFDRIVSFDASNFEKDDINALIKMLKEMDLIKDGKKSLEDGVEFIKNQDLRPHGTERLNAIEQQKAAQKFRIEQQKANELNSKKLKFDEFINVLYGNNLNNIAVTCSHYRPTSLETKDLENSEYLIKLISDNIKNGKILNKQKLESEITYFDSYNEYVRTGKSPSILKNAENFAADKAGNINKLSAGQYIVNSEIVQTYPNCLEFVKNPEIVTQIMNKTYSDNNAAVKYLCKFDNYTNMSANDKTFISKLTDIFNIKDSVEKSLLKYIIENDYTKNNTTVQTLLNEKGSETVNTTISANAKRSVMEQYKFPNCLEYFKAFEDALQSFATATGTSGIKKVGTNNRALEYKWELKIKGHDDRLFAVDDNYYFDIFSNRGLH